VLRERCARIRQQRRCQNGDLYSRNAGPSAKHVPKRIPKHGPDLQKANPTICGSRLEKIKIRIRVCLQAYTQGIHHQSRLQALRFDGDPKV